MIKIISTFLLIIMFAVFMPLLPKPVATTTTFEPVEFGACPSGTYRVRKHTRKKTKLVNSLIAGGVGAAIGGGIGGGRGALIGLGSGAGGYLAYRFIRDERGRCVRRYVRG